MSIVDINDFDIRNLSFDKINPAYQRRLENEKRGIQSQYSIFAKYEGKPLSLCLTIDQLIGGQTPNKDKSGKEFCDINSPNIKFSIGLDPKQPDCVKLKEVIRSIEKKLQDNIQYLLEDELKEKGRPFKNYILYSTIKPCKVPSEDDPDIKVEVEDTPEHFSRFNVKYEEEFGSGIVKTIFETDDELETGGFKKYPVSTKKDITEIPLWKKKVRILFKLVRVWVSKMPLLQGTNKGYGLVFKLTRVHIFDKDTTDKKSDDENENWMKGIRKKEKKTEQVKSEILDDGIISEDDDNNEEHEKEKEKEKEKDDEKKEENINEDEEEIFEEILSAKPNTEKKKKKKKHDE